MTRRLDVLEWNALTSTTISDDNDDDDDDDDVF
jgi:hypothetical protein